MTFVVPEWAFSALIWGSLGLAGAGAVALLALLTLDIRNRNTW